jgi:hypothetical protein
MWNIPVLLRFLVYNRKIPALKTTPLVSTCCVISRHVKQNLLCDGFTRILDLLSVSCVQNLNMKYMTRYCRIKSWFQNHWHPHQMFVPFTASCSQAHRPWRRYTCPSAFFTILLTSLTYKTEHCRCEFNGAKQNIALDVARHGDTLVCISFSTFSYIR